MPAHPGWQIIVGTWLSLVEHSLGVRGVGSSNLPVPTIIFIFSAVLALSEILVENLEFVAGLFAGRAVCVILDGARSCAR